MFASRMTPTAATPASARVGVSLCFTCWAYSIAARASLRNAALSEPGAASFVDVGQPVRRNQVLCIIEAMKLMNEITSEYEGELVKCYVENGQAVQYGERLFAIKAK